MVWNMDIVGIENNGSFVDEGKCVVVKYVVVM